MQAKAGAGTFRGVEILGLMLRHLQKSGNAECLQYAEKSDDARLIATCERVAAGAPTRPCACCNQHIKCSEISGKFQHDLKATKNWSERSVFAIRAQFHRPLVAQILQPGIAVSLIDGAAR